MKRLSVSLFCLIGFVAPLAAQAADMQAADMQAADKQAADSADVLDLGAVKCKAFLAADKDEIGFTIAWLDGYYRDEDTPAIIDFDKLKTEAAKLGAYCGEHPDASVGTAAEDVLGK